MKTNEDPHTLLLCIVDTFIGWSLRTHQGGQSPGSIAATGDGDLLHHTPEPRNKKSKAAKPEIPQNLTLIAAGGHEETSPRTFPLVVAESNCGHHGKSPGRRCARGGVRRRRSGEERRRRRRDSERGVRRVGAVNGLDRGSRAHEQRGGSRNDISPRLADRAPTWPAVVSCHVGKNSKNVRFAATVVLNL